MLLRITRSWHNISSIHLIQVKDPPVQPLFFTQRGLIIHPKRKEIPTPTTVQINFKQPQPLIKQMSQPPLTYFYNQHPPQPAPPTVKTTRKKLKTSMKKIHHLMKIISQKHVEDAIQEMKISRKKPAYWIQKMIEKGIRAAVQTKDMEADRLYIKQAMMGRNTPARSIRRKARGTFTGALKPRTQVTLILEEKPVEGLFNNIVNGNYSPALAKVLKHKLFTEDASYADLRRYQNLLTAKGRQQQRLMLKREVDGIYFENKKKGIEIPKSLLEKELVSERAKAFAEMYWAAKRREVEVSRNERMEIYKANQGIN